MPQDTDVIIVGAVRSGLVATNELLNDGKSILLLDQESESNRVTRSGDQLEASSLSTHRSNTRRRARHRRGKRPRNSRAVCAAIPAGMCRSRPTLRLRHRLRVTELLTEDDSVVRAGRPASSR
ncbi:FAD-dependent monooxygenase [Klugiella xanthotipulae]|uniref:FAD-dependent monooxygenase n=1 Tax=Klugiella xanthotipulae TaxID=244735 RepID=UPI003CCC811D